jgi:subtilase family serine protease
LVSESAWSGSGGGLSSYIPEPSYQKNSNIPKTQGYRATPDVSYNADPSSGYPVYNSVPYSGYKGWFQVGGTSAGTPQWAAIASLSNKTVTAANLYRDASLLGQTSIRDITGGTNGSCSYYCSAQTGYDYVTGLGSPLVSSF